MGFRNPITTASGVDTGEGDLTGPGVRLYQDTAGLYPRGVAEWRSGLDDEPATIALTAINPGQGAGTLGSSFTIEGPRTNGVRAPGMRLAVSESPYFGYVGSLVLGVGGGRVQMDPASYVAGAVHTKGAQGAISTGWGSTTFLWVAALGAKQTVPQDYQRRAYEGLALCNIAGTGWWRVRCDLAANPEMAEPAASLYWPNATGFRAAVPAGAELTQAIQIPSGGTLTGTQQATFYIEARAEVAGGANFIIPTLNLRFT